MDLAGLLVRHVPSNLPDFRKLSVALMTPVSCIIQVWVKMMLYYKIDYI